MLLKMQDVLTVACGLPHFNNTESYAFESSGGSKGREGGAQSMAQSMAARDRRKKISDKTQELGKLVPGVANRKMNTAVRSFRVLSSMSSFFKLRFQFFNSWAQIPPLRRREKKESRQRISRLWHQVQEKLYMKDNCLVPVEFLEQLAGNGDVQRQGSIAKDLK